MRLRDIPLGNGSYIGVDEKGIIRDASFRGDDANEFVDRWLNSFHEDVEAQRMAFIWELLEGLFCDPPLTVDHKFLATSLIVLAIFSTVANSKLLAYPNLTSNTNTQ